MKLLILLKDIDGGTGTYLEGLLGLKKLFKTTEIKIRVLVIYKPKFRNTKHKSYKYFTNDHHKYDLTFGNINSTIKELRWFRQNVDEFRPDIVIASNFHSIFISELAKLVPICKYKTISIIQNNLIKVIEYKLPKTLRPLAMTVFGLFLNSSDKVVTVSKYLSIDIQKEFHLETIPSTIPVILPKEFTNRTERTGGFKNKIVISASRLDDQKDYKTLLSAFRLINNRVPKSQLWIVGDGPNKDALKILSKNLGITNKIKFFDWLQNPIKIMKSSSVFVLSSNYEGFPLSVIEAMTCALPIVATDCKYGPAEILQNNEYGLLVTAGDSISLANSVTNLLTDRKLYDHYSKMSYLRLLDYPQEQMLFKYKNLILELIAN